MQDQQPSEFDAAMQYLAEVASTYAKTLEPVVRAPFVNQVNTAIRAVKAEHDRLSAKPAPEPAED